MRIRAPQSTLTATDTVFERARARICGLDPPVHHTIRPNACERDYVRCTVCSGARHRARPSERVLGGGLLGQLSYLCSSSVLGTRAHSCIIRYVFVFDCPAGIFTWALLRISGHIDDTDCVGVAILSQRKAHSDPSE